MSIVASRPNNSRIFWRCPALRQFRSRWARRASK